MLARDYCINTNLSLYRQLPAYITAVTYHVALLTVLNTHSRTRILSYQRNGVGHTGTRIQDEPPSLILRRHHSSEIR